MFLIILSTSFSAACNTMFSDELNIRVLDAKNRPLENATVTVTFQVDKTTAKGYTTTLPLLTSSDGTTYVKIQNLEQVSSNVDCNIVINAEYDGKTAKKTVIANSHENLIDLKLDVYSIFLTIKDSEGKLLEGALASANLIQSKTNNIGFTVLRVGAGTKTLFITYGGATRQYTVQVNDDTTYAVSFFLKDVVITVLDDYGNPLLSKASWSGKEYQSDANGKIIVPSIGVISPSITVIYQGLTKIPDMDLDRQTEYTVVFDMTPPKIISVVDKKENNLVKLLITIEDPGEYSSNVDPSSFSVRYDTGSGWNNAKAYKQGTDLYVAEMQGIELNSVVYFEIYVKDYDLNSVSLPGTFSVFEQDPDDNGDNGSEDPVSESDLLLPGAVLLIILLAIAYFLYTRTKKETISPEKETPPPEKPL